MHTPNQMICFFFLYMLTMVFKPFQNTIYIDACRLGVELLVSLDVSKGFKPKTSIQLISQHIVNIYIYIYNNFSGMFK